MSEKKRIPDDQAEEIIKAFERERSEARDLSRRHSEATRDARRRDRQVLIERRRQPR
jgi:uncharacterized tellurite resistance protein B-like protein